MDFSNWFRHAPPLVTVAMDFMRCSSVSKMTTEQQKFQHHSLAHIPDNTVFFFFFGRMRPTCPAKLPRETLTQDFTQDISMKSKFLMEQAEIQESQRSAGNRCRKDKQLHIEIKPEEIVESHYVCKAGRVVFIWTDSYFVSYEFSFWVCSCMHVSTSSEPENPFSCVQATSQNFIPQK